MLVPGPAGEVHCLGEVRQQSGKKLGEPGKAEEPASRVGGVTGRQRLEGSPWLLISWV